MAQTVKARYSSAMMISPVSIRILPPVREVTTASRAPSDREAGQVWRRDGRLKERVTIAQMLKARYRSAMMTSPISIGSNHRSDSANDDVDQRDEQVGAKEEQEHRDQRADFDSSPPVLADRLILDDGPEGRNQRDADCVHEPDEALLPGSEGFEQHPQPDDGLGNSEREPDQAYKLVGHRVRQRQVKHRDSRGHDRPTDPRAGSEPRPHRDCICQRLAIPFN